MSIFTRRSLLAALVSALLAGAMPHPALARDFLAGCTILIIRHAEAPATGRGLAPEGERRARAYAHYFKPFTADGGSQEPELLIASTDSDNSERPRLTLEPLAQALGLPVDTSFANHQEKELAVFLSTKPHGRSILIAWHHHKLAKLIRALGGEPAAVLPDGQWPDTTYDWVVELKFDSKGVLASQRLIKEAPSLLSQ